MVRNVRYITLNSTHRDLHEILLIGNMKTVALVESAGTLYMSIHIHDALSFYIALIPHGSFVLIDTFIFALNKNTSKK